VCLSATVTLLAEDLRSFIEFKPIFGNNKVSYLIYKEVPKAKKIQVAA